MLYLLDANVLITANNTYYPVNQVPEYWEWLRFHGDAGNVKMPIEILDEVLAGHKENDPLLDWLKDTDTISALSLQEEVDHQLVQRVVATGYAPDLTDDELEQLGRDPFLVAYALAGPDRCVVTTEVSRPGKTRQNRKIPDVCKTFSIQCLDPFALNRMLGFKTGWKTVTVERQIPSD